MQHGDTCYFILLVRIPAHQQLIKLTGPFQAKVTLPSTTSEAIPTPNHFSRGSTPNPPVSLTSIIPPWPSSDSKPGPGMTNKAYRHLPLPAATTNSAMPTTRTPQTWKLAALSGLLFLWSAAITFTRGTHRDFLLLVFGVALPSAILVLMVFILALMTGSRTRRREHAPVADDTADLERVWVLVEAKER
ncbi:hypothetical protein Purlil1_6451 [Purpureocillium lilacinum]|uniref:Uncharacterized protein n=1 Tax=Purpureocillium lilacinum TaxID=33203 RepID=A0ABR0BZB7_PURLI|nr:hypothetical protein Purlil1_6451 [Purpureocillium lilacinum]